MSETDGILIVGPCDIDTSCNYRILQVILVNKQVTYERFFFSLVRFVCVASMDTSSSWVLSGDRLVELSPLKEISVPGPSRAEKGDFEMT